ncbi:hypothetical protein G210_5677 [Candida maltosa Xu316]|uniref:Uncharacterized protein n=1 Tax=Candida maltosa (strain Xu316) TaxID=1245528 RepID=M3K6T6_CANMX|nr:hypothetical protein G210_5677 [Candida maltosa Xu316]
MRSFIKSHRKNDSNVSTTSDALILENQSRSNTNSSVSASDEYHPPNTYSNRSSTTPIASPKMQQYPQYTPPPTGQSSMSSPKKLLTPIKNLFTSASHSKSALTTPSSAESFNANVTGITGGGGSSPKNKFRKHRRSRSHISISNELSQLPEEPSTTSSLFDNKNYQKLKPFEHYKPVVKSSKSTSSLSALDAMSPDPAKKSRPSSTEALSKSGSSKGSKKKNLRSRHITSLPLPSKPRSSASELGPPISLAHTYSNDTSDPSIAESESKFQTKDVLFDNVPSSSNDDIKSQTIYMLEKENTGKVEKKDDQDDDDEEYDSSSSQFSFVQDMKGGRNTSVKYYKKNIKPPAPPEGGISNTFNEHDLGYEVDEFSDYDYENNGGDLDDDYEGFEEEDDAQYNKFYDDQEDIEDEINKLGSPLGYINQSQQSNLNSIDNIDNGESLKSPINDTQFPASDISKTRNPFNRAFHLSILGPRSETPKDSPAKSNFEEDILENYLVISDSDHDDFYSNDKDGSGDNFELFALNSPLINGLTIGNNLRHRSSRHLNFANANRLIIHRKPIAFYDDSANGSGANLTEKEVFTKYVHSFHGSFDDGFNKTIHDKVKGFEDFVESRPQTKGLGISLDQPGVKKDEGSSASNSLNSRLTGQNSDINSNETNTSTMSATAKSKPATNTNVRQSVSDMMAILGNFEESTKEQTKEVEKSTTRDSVVNMMAILSNLEENVKSDNTTTETSKQQVRNSIIGMMDVLSNLEKQTTEKPKEEPKANLRNSVLGMMDILANLENNNTETSDKKESRKSVVDMLSSLSALQNEAEPQEPPKQKSQLESVREEPKRKASFKRYSWFNSQENLSLTKEKSTNKECDPTDDNDKYNTSLDQDLLDEINQIPDDFDFDQQRKDQQKSPQQQNQQQQQQLTSNSLLSKDRNGFYRSNSYNRKPKKTVVSNQFQSNRIETTNKTVTFYNTSPSSSLSVSRSQSLSRGPSTRSMNSFASVNEEEEEEEDIDDDLIREANHESDFQFNHDSYKTTTTTSEFGGGSKRIPSYRQSINRYHR